MKKLPIALLVVFLCLLFAGVGWAAGEMYNGYPVVNLVVNGNAVETDVPPVIMDGRTMVPVRFVAENLGAAVGWWNNTVNITTSMPWPALNTEAPIITGPDYFYEIIKNSIGMAQKVPEMYPWIIGNIKEIIYTETPEDKYKDTAGYIKYDSRTCYIIAADFEGVREKSIPKSELSRFYLGYLAHESAHIYIDRSGVGKLLNQDDKELLCNIIALRMIQKVGGRDTDISVKVFKKIIEGELHV